jgi:hypothetical protein
LERGGKNINSAVVTRQSRAQSLYGANEKCEHNVIYKALLIPSTNNSREVRESEEIFTELSRYFLNLEQWEVLVNAKRNGGSLSCESLKYDGDQW